MSELADLEYMDTIEDISQGSNVSQDNIMRG